MPFEKMINQDLPVSTPPCIYLRSKAMYVEGTQRPTTDSPCWCNLTQHVLGPDQSFVGVRECGTGRTCYRETIG